MALRDEIKGLGFVLPELIIESVIRDGLANLVNRPTAIDNVFAQLTRPYNDRKYGESELDKIRKLIAKEQISVVHSFNEVPTNLPCYSIQLSSDSEPREKQYLGDFEDDVLEYFTSPEDLADLVVVESLTIDAYNPKSGKVSLPNSVNLADVHVNLLLVDASGSEFRITGGISNEPGDKSVFIAKNQTVDISGPASIKSSLNYRQYELGSVQSQASVIIGVHTKNALTTKYLYTLLKYFLLSRKQDLIRRCFTQATFQGSDFTRDMRYEGDMVYTRFFTITGIVQDSWRGDEVDLVDNIEVESLVPKNRATAETMEASDLTVKPTDRDDFDC